ncbi:hypothetical protein CIG19_20045 [Enterobacterales bacterium CwR94]|nr:hypothetical protein CIG19_20045 [Enterobacterales bacterium CwR94]
MPGGGGSYGKRLCGRHFWRILLRITDQRTAERMEEEKYICHQCIGDEYVSLTVKNNGDAGENCSYCNNKIINLPLDTVADMMHEVFNRNFRVFRQDIYYFDHNSGSPAEDIISECLDVFFEIASDIHNILQNKHNEYMDGWEEVYSEDYIYRRITPVNGELDSAWEEMKRSLQSEARFFNRSVKEFLDNIFDDLSTFQTENSGSAIVTVDSDCAIYRARVFENYAKVEEALRHPERHFGPPPPDIATSGRMNAYGIPVFYGATSPDTALAEVRPAVGSFVVVAEFRPINSLQVLDLSALDQLSISEESYFDPKIIRRNEITAFLRTLSRKLTLPVSGRNPDSEYLITQAVAEYLSVSQKHNLDGITFRSTQKKNEDKEKENHDNIVLFSRSSTVKNADSGRDTFAAELFEYDYDDERSYEWFSPEIKKIDEETGKSHSYSSRGMTERYSLELLADQITFYEISGVKYHAEPTKIRHGNPVRRKSQRTD